MYTHTEQEQHPDMLSVRALKELAEDGGGTPKANGSAKGI